MPPSTASTSSSSAWVRACACMLVNTTKFWPGGLARFTCMTAEEKALIECDKKSWKRSYFIWRELWVVLIECGIWVASLNPKENLLNHVVGKCNLLPRVWLDDIKLRQGYLSDIASFDSLREEKSCLRGNEKCRESKSSFFFLPLSIALSAKKWVGNRRGIFHPDGFRRADHWLERVREPDFGISEFSHLTA